MAGYKIQLKDKNGNRQYPVSTVDVVVDADGVSVADLLDRKQPTLVSGVNIKTINGKTLLGEGDLVIEGGSSSGETAESDVICVVWDDDTSDIPSNKEAYQKLAECCETVGKPAAVMVCVETGYRWGIEHFYWKTRFEDIELVTPVRNDGMYAIFTLTSEGVCTADFKQVSLGGGGESVLGNNVITLYEPTIDGDTDEIVSTDECLAEIENNFGYDIEIPQEIKDAVSAFVISMKEHNASEYARARELNENGEKVMVMLRGYGYPMILLGIYLLALVETGKPPITPEEFVSDFSALTSMEEMIFPKRYIATDSIEGEFGIEVAHDRYTLNPDENGEWTITSTESVRKYAILYYEGTARLTAQQCETNLKSKGNRLNNCDFQVNRYRGDGWSDNEDVLIIGKSTKTVSDFVNLNGDVVTCGVTAFQYIEDTKLIELQVSNEDGYCRKVVLGQLQLA